MKKGAKDESQPILDKQAAEHFIAARPLDLPASLYRTALHQRSIAVLTEAPSLAASRPLRDWELADLVEAGELIVSELADNAAKTGCRRKMAVSVERITDGCVRISVRDGSRTLPCLINAGPAAESGCGIALVHHLTGGHWDTTLEHDGKTVHADLRLRPAGPLPTDCSPDFGEVRHPPHHDWKDFPCPAAFRRSTP